MLGPLDLALNEKVRGGQNCTQKKFGGVASYASKLLLLDELIIIQTLSSKESFLLKTYNFLSIEVCQFRNKIF